MHPPLQTPDRQALSAHIETWNVIILMTTGNESYVHKTDLF